MSEEKIGQHYLAALHQAFPGVVLDEAWQTKDQLTITVKVNYLPEVVEFLYYQILPVLWYLILLSIQPCRKKLIVTLFQLNITQKIRFVNMALMEPVISM